MNSDDKSKDNSDNLPTNSIKNSPSKRIMDYVANLAINEGPVSSQTDTNSVTSQVPNVSVSKLPKIKTIKSIVKPKFRKNPGLAGFLAGLIALVVINIIIGVININYIQKRPITVGKNISIGGIDMTAKKPDDVKQLLTTAANSQMISIDVNGRKITSTANEMGISRNIKLATDQAIATNRPFLQKIGIQHKNTIDTKIPVAVDQTKLNSFIANNLGNDLIAQNAELTVDGGSFEVKPGIDGVAVNIDKLANDIMPLKLTDNNIHIVTETKPVKPQIETNTAEIAKEKAMTLVSPTYTVGNDSVGFKTIPKSTKVKWVSIKSNPDTKNIDVSLNKDTAVNSIVATAKSFNKAASEKVSVSMPNSGEVVLENGNDGVSVSDAELANIKILATQALEAKQDTTIPVATTPIARGVKTMNGEEKMVLVDVQRYTTYAFQNGQIIKQVVVSTGKAGHETPAGRFTVQFKIAESDMKGCAFDGCWTVPNVKWQTYFTNQGHALHAAYWYVNWGYQNVSHGCVNMHTDDAKWFYDWTEIGTPVVVVR